MRDHSPAASTFVLYRCASLHDTKGELQQQVHEICFSARFASKSGFGWFPNLGSLLANLSREILQMQNHVEGTCLCFLGSFTFRHYNPGLPNLLCLHYAVETMGLFSGWSLKFTLGASSALVTVMCIATYFGYADPNFTAVLIVGLCIAISLAVENPLPVDATDDKDGAPKDDKQKKAK